MARQCAILSIDGGGIRGVIPCVILAELEKRLKKAGKDSALWKHFRMIAGTSTGGIIAGGLTCPSVRNRKKPAMDASSLLSLYEDRGADIFTRDLFGRIREAITNPRSIIQEKYDHTVLQAELIKHMGRTATLKDGLTDVMLTAYDIEERATVHMRSTHTAADGRGAADNYLFWEACRATSAAPTYFEPARVENLTTGKLHTLVDGGVFANDPGMSAYVEALRLPDKVLPEDIMMVSLGTGHQNRRFPFDEVKNWGPVNWINPAKGAPIISILMHGQAHAAAFHLQTILNKPKKPKRYFRFDAPLSIGNDDMDDASDTNIRELKTLAQQIILAQSAALDEVVNWL